ncbi:MAG: M1 family metallopeptidase [Planctomycetota bacterium]
MTRRASPPLLPVLTLVLLAAPALGAGEPMVVNHDLQVRIDPGSHSLVVEDEVTLPPGLAAPPEGEEGISFLLHGALRVDAADAEWLVELRPGTPRLSRHGINEDGEREVPLREHLIRPATGAWPEKTSFRLRYRGSIHHPLATEGEEYARSFSSTPGIISEEGVVLSGSSWWLPLFGEAAAGGALVRFRLAVDLPAGWDVVSQGERLSAEEVDGRRRVVWSSPEPMDEVYLIAARFTEYTRAAGGAVAQAFLRTPDPNLAARYLEATVQYLDMYNRLIGPYPYKKFALVENFWETGYGMPSFTLLGPKIIRFPFILHSSYPHEILHNWWGNSVFVDYESGNWCEGLTAYLADHLIKEGQGRGVEYRRDTLKKYRSYVRGARDFPLAEFRSRHSSATEAVGYGKSLMLWHMLRMRLGEDSFARGLSRFYRRHRFQRASFGDIEAVFSEIAGTDLGPFFRQWVDRTGAPIPSSVMP